MIIELKLSFTSQFKQFLQISVKSTLTSLPAPPQRLMRSVRKFLFNFCCLSFLCFKFSQTRLERSRTSSKQSSPSSRDSEDREKHRVRSEVAQIEVKTRFNKWPRIFVSPEAGNLLNLLAKPKRKAIFLSSRPAQTIAPFIRRSAACKTALFSGVAADNAERTRRNPELP